MLNFLGFVESILMAYIDGDGDGDGDGDFQVLADETPGRSQNFQSEKTKVYIKK